MRYFPLASLFILCSCQEVKRGPAAVGSFNYSDPNHKELSVYVNRFYSKMASAGFDNYNRDITFIFSYAMPTGTVATCGFPDNNINKSVITFNMTYWESYSSGDKESTVFHEMGHCVLLRDHLPTLSNGKPISLMNPYIVLSDTYLPRRNYYIGELFSKAKIARTGSGSQAAKNFSFQIVESYEGEHNQVMHKKIDCNPEH